MFAVYRFLTSNSDTLRVKKRKGSLNVKIPGEARNVLTVTVPATTANLACGFDAFGAAFEFRMVVESRLAPPTQTETVFEYEGEGAEEVAKNETNLIWQSALACIQKYGAGKTMPKLNVRVKVCPP